MLKVKTYFTPNVGQSEHAVAEENDGTVSMEIQDTGHGMSKETLANLFVPYYTTKSEANGRGLGVPIVRRIVTEHGADMDFQSNEGEGTTVRIHFPYNQETRSEEFTAAPEELIPHTSLVTELETEDPTIDTKD